MSFLSGGVVLKAAGVAHRAAPARSASSNSAFCAFGWARLRFAVVGPLLASPPPPGRLHTELERLAEQCRGTAVTRSPIVRIGAKTVVIRRRMHVGRFRATLNGLGGFKWGIPANEYRNRTR